jgi:hypothetical protein
MQSGLPWPDPSGSPIASRPRAASVYVRKPGNGPIQLPGYGLPVQEMTVNRDPKGPKIRHPISDGVSSDPVTVRELRMLQFMDQITDKPDWEKKVFDETILAKWKDEAGQEVDVDGAADVMLSERMFEYVR